MQKTNDELLDRLHEGSQQQTPPKPKRTAHGAGALDPAHYEPVRFSFASVQAGCNMRPERVWPVERGVVGWSKKFQQAESTMSNVALEKGQRARQGLLTDFAALEEASDRQVHAFIKRWGVLGLSTDVEQGLGAAAGAAGFCQELTNTYRFWARRVRAVQTIARALQQGQPASLEDWAVWLEHPGEEKAVSRYYRAVHDYYLLLVRSNVPADLLGKIDTNHDPAVKAAQEDIEQCKTQDYSLWEWLKQHHLHPDLPPDERVSRSCVQLARIMDGWLVSRTWYLFNEKDALGQARPVTQMQLADNMRGYFWNGDLAEDTILLPLGQALLHSIQSPMVACKVCGKVVQEAQARRDRSQFCSDVCRAVQQRQYVRSNDAKRKAAGSAKGPSLPPIPSNPLTAPPAMPAPGVAE